MMTAVKTTFDKIKVYERFTRGKVTSLVWTKCQPFTAYGYIKNQNAATYAEPHGPWHYDKVHDDEEVTLVTEVRTD